MVDPSRAGRAGSRSHGRASSVTTPCAATPRSARRPSARRGSASGTRPTGAGRRRPWPRRSRRRSSAASIRTRSLDRAAPARAARTASRAASAAARATSSRSLAKARSRAARAALGELVEAGIPVERPAPLAARARAVGGVEASRRPRRRPRRPALFGPKSPAARRAMTRRRRRRRSQRWNAEQGEEAGHDQERHEDVRGDFAEGVGGHASIVTDRRRFGRSGEPGDRALGSGSPSWASGPPRGQPSHRGSSSLHPTDAAHRNRAVTGATGSHAILTAALSPPQGAQMKVGVPKETLPGERRVALVPEVLPKLKAAGIDVLVERGAGAAASYHRRDVRGGGRDARRRRRGLVARPTASSRSRSPPWPRSASSAPARRSSGCSPRSSTRRLMADARRPRRDRHQPRRDPADALARADDGRPLLAGEHRRLQGRPRRRRGLRALLPAPDDRGRHRQARQRADPRDRRRRASRRSAPRAASAPSSRPTTCAPRRRSRPSRSAPSSSSSRPRSTRPAAAATPAS